MLPKVFVKFCAQRYKRVTVNQSLLAVPVVCKAARYASVCVDGIGLCTFEQGCNECVSLVWINDAHMISCLNEYDGKAPSKALQVHAPDFCLR